MPRAKKSKKLSKTKPVSLRLEQSFYDCWKEISDITGADMVEIFRQSFIRTFKIQRSLSGEYVLPKDFSEE